MLPRTYNRARKFLMRTGVAAAPFVITWHFCPISDEVPLVAPPEHVEQHAHHPIEINRIELMTSASSSGGNLAVRVDDEHVRVGHQVFRAFPID